MELCPGVVGVMTVERMLTSDTTVAEQISAGVLAYECDGEIEDIGLYKDNAIAVLTTGVTQQHKGRLAVLPSAALARQPLPEAALHVRLGFILLVPP